MNPIANRPVLIHTSAMRPSRLNERQPLQTGGVFLARGRGDDDDVGLVARQCRRRELERLAGACEQSEVDVRVQAPRRARLGKRFAGRKFEADEAAGGGV